jgi:hypothetical protein
MNRDDPSESRSPCPWVLCVFVTLCLTACSSSVGPPKGAGVDYQQAKITFKQGNLDRALSLTDAMAESKVDSPETFKARVLRAIIYSGRIDAYRQMADTYKKGSSIATKSRTVTSYNRRRSNALQYGGEAALSLGEVIMQLTYKPDFPKEFTLDAPWPDVEGPTVIDAFARIQRGAWVPEAAQDSAGVDLQHKGIADVLAELLGGDRSKARAAVEAGAVKLNGLDFALFLERKMVDGIELFGPKYLANPGQLKTLCDVTARLGPPIEAMLKQKPDKTKEAEFDKAQKQIKDAGKYT